MDITASEIKAANRMKQLRIDSGMTQEEVAKKIGVHKSTILRWENGNGTSKIKIPVIDALSRIYGVSPVYLMGMTDDPIDFREDAGEKAFKTYMQVLGDVARGLNQEYRQKLLEMANLLKLGQDNEQKEKPSEDES